MPKAYTRGDLRNSFLTRLHRFVHYAGDRYLSRPCCSARLIMTLNELIRQSIAALTPLCDEREARASLRLIFDSIKGWSPVDLAIRGADQASPFVVGKVTDIINRMLSHEPVQYILGETSWHGLKLKVSPAVLIPRPETSELVDLIVKETGGRSDLRVADLCTGSGCIAIALARNLPFATVDAVDISAAALDVARANGEALRTGRAINWIEADVTDPSSLPAGPFDIIVSNPPYIAEDERGCMDKNVLLYEPEMALFVPDDDPLIFYRAISAYALRTLNPGGRLFLELNPIYADRLADQMRGAGWYDVELIRDVHSAIRFMSATAPRP